MRALVAVLVALVLPGCALPLVEEPEVKEVSGPTDGYTPTAAYLKVHVEQEDGRTALLDFDRREWNTAEIAKRLDQKDVRFLSAQAMPREILNEFVVENVGAPGELQQLHFDTAGATPEQRAAADAEYEKLLQRFNAAIPESVPSSPAVTIPSLP